MVIERVTKPTGRPSKLTPELQKKICKYIAEGNYLSVACHAVGIWDTTLNDWMHKAEEEKDSGDGCYYRFYLAVKEAEALQEAKIAERLLAGAMPGERKRVTKTGPDGVSLEVTETGGDWLAAATYLERRHPDRWGRKDRTRIDINETKEITITHVEYNLTGLAPGQVVEGESRELLGDRSPLGEAVKGLKDGELP